MPKIRYSKKITSDRKILVGLDSVVKSGGTDARSASSLIVWYFRNQTFTESQIRYARTMIKSESTVHLKKRKESKHFVFAIKCSGMVFVGEGINPELKAKRLGDKENSDTEIIWRRYSGKNQIASDKVLRKLQRFSKKHIECVSWYKPSVTVALNEFNAM